MPSATSGRARRPSSGARTASASAIRTSSQPADRAQRHAAQQRRDRVAPGSPGPAISSPPQETGWQILQDRRGRADDDDLVARSARDRTRLRRDVAERDRRDVALPARCSRSRRPSSPIAPHVDLARRARAWSRLRASRSRRPRRAPAAARRRGRSGAAPLPTGPWRSAWPSRPPNTFVVPSVAGLGRAE